MRGLRKNHQRLQVIISGNYWIYEGLSMGTSVAHGVLRRQWLLREGESVGVYGEP
jgi:hypothetical protein